MKLIPCVRRAASLSMAGAWALVLPLAGATPETTGTPAPTPSPEVLAVKPVTQGDDTPRIAALRAAVDLFRDGKDAAALKQLRESCTRGSDDPDQAVELVCNMSFAATVLRDTGNRTAGERVGRLALKELDRLDQSPALAGDKVRRKGLLQHSAHVAADLLNDDAETEERLGRAAALDPDDADAQLAHTKARENAVRRGAIKEGKG